MEGLKLFPCLLFDLITSAIGQTTSDTSLECQHGKNPNWEPCSPGDPHKYQEKVCRMHPPPTAPPVLRKVEVPRLFSESPHQTTSTSQFYNYHSYYMMQLACIETILFLNKKRIFKLKTGKLLDWWKWLRGAIKKKPTKFWTLSKHGGAVSGAAKLFFEKR